MLVLTCGLTRTESETRVPSAARGLDTSEARGLDTGDTRPTRGATRGLEKTCATNVTAQAGMTARMYCCLGVRNKGAEVRCQSVSGADTPRWSHCIVSAAVRHSSTDEDKDGVSVEIYPGPGAGVRRHK